SGFSAAKRDRWRASTTASAAPALIAAGTKSCPSRLSPVIAKKASPGAIVRESIEIPETEPDNGPAHAQSMAAAMASTVQSGGWIMPLFRQAQRQRLRGR